ncbi:hypothetical protein C0Q70_18606 [Pomacea canaliculata]|uniref:2'-5'-oligoadenylate synthetase 1 domain-containing protein n=1 Tax=Pomacea canaliculata TaxID=400727 RepID=A0A2T7NH03_POMCA|nr:2'-5'-oligoadenylate synthase 1A-like [Pomacea canaliculata]PVD20450.1 hypothetical protein C0Q70_18606 [Pomacea canaliculata]
MPKIFDQQNPGESLDEFSQRQVSTTESERRRLEGEVDRFVKYLHEQPFRSPYSVKEVIKSGSLGKGTAVRNRVDIDLVVFVNGLTSIDHLETARPELLADLEETLRQSARIQPISRTRFSLKYNWNDIEVDILPAVDVLSLYGSPSKVYEVMGRYGSAGHAAQQFSASLAQLQRDFVKDVPEHVKKAIRLVKLWKKENHLDIRSYSLELLTIYVWQIAGKGNPGTDYLFCEVMSQLSTCGTLRVAFDVNYNSSFYIRSMSSPYIMDPANPYMNTLHRTSIGATSESAMKVHRCLTPQFWSLSHVDCSRPVKK